MHAILLSPISLFSVSAQPLWPGRELDAEMGNKIISKHITLNWDENDYFHQFVI